ncbi:MAG TPA: hypothetical protein VIK25_15140 [Gemmatimonadaceae bacterium]
MTPSEDFSQRYGLATNRAVQLASMDDELRNGLWNAIHFTFFVPHLHLVRVGAFVADATLQRFILLLAADVVKIRVDALSPFWSGQLEPVRQHFDTVPWHRVYDFVEFVAQHADKDDAARVPAFLKECNRVLERELAGYRFVGKQLVRITDSSELQQIEMARNQPGTLATVQVNLDTALRHLSNREKPDFRNSIKESISAVEGYCSLLAGQEQADLDAALRTLEVQIALHPALKKAFRQLYGYSSDASGIRHALLDEETLNFEDAQFMLVACAAFINYMSALAARAGVTLKGA